MVNFCKYAGGAINLFSLIISLFKTHFRNQEELLQIKLEQPNSFIVDPQRLITYLKKSTETTW